MQKERTNMELQIKNIANATQLTSEFIYNNIHQRENCCKSHIKQNKFILRPRETSFISLI